MSRNESKVREPRVPEDSEMVELMRRGVIEALRGHQAEGRSVITWDRATRQIVEVPPDEIFPPIEPTKTDSH